MWRDWSCRTGGYDVYDLDKHVGQKFFEYVPVLSFGLELTQQ
jgi:hypothetical protein